MVRTTGPVRLVDIVEGLEDSASVISQIGLLHVVRRFSGWEKAIPLNIHCTYIHMKRKRWYGLDKNKSCLCLAII